MRYFESWKSYCYFPKLFFYRKKVLKNVDIFICPKKIVIPQYKWINKIFDSFSQTFKQFIFN